MPPPGTRPRHVDLRHRLALGDPNPQRVRQDPLDGGGLDQRHHFQVALDAGQIQRQQIVSEL